MTRDEGGKYSHQIDLTRCSVESRLAIKRVISKDGEFVSIDPYARSDAVKVLTELWMLRDLAGQGDRTLSKARTTELQGARERAAVRRSYSAKIAELLR